MIKLLISIIEFVVYGLIAYSSLLVLIISSIKENIASRVGSMVRVVWMVPGIVASALLADLGNSISFPVTSTTIINLNTTEVTEETITPTLTLIDPIWYSFHFLIMVTLSLFVIFQVFYLITQKN